MVRAASTLLVALLSQSVRGRALGGKFLEPAEQLPRESFARVDQHLNASLEVDLGKKNGNMLVLPQQKLAVCTIAKNALQNFNYMFNDINGLDQIWALRTSNFKAFGLNWRHISKGGGWKFALFTRDPVERYLSAWGSKCLPSSWGLAEHDGTVEDGGRNCCGELVLDTSSEERVIREFERRVYYDLRHGLTRNDHWDLQTRTAEHCDWTKFSPDAVDYSISLSDDDAAVKVETMLSEVGTPNASAVSSRYFPRQGIHGHKSDTHDKVAKFYRDPQTVMAVYTLYKEDYDTLGLPHSELLKWAMQKMPYYPKPKYWEMHREPRE